MARLTGKKLPITVDGMDDQRAWFSEVAKRRVTTTEIGEHLGVTRKTAQSRLDAGLSADDIITIARAVKVSPMDALIELGKLTYPEVYEFVEREGKLLGTASDGELALELAQRLNSLRDAKDWWAVYEKTNALHSHQSTDSSVDETEPTADNVHELTSRGQAQRVANVDPQALIESNEPYAANTDQDPRPDDDHSWDA